MTAPAGNIPLSAPWGYTPIEGVERVIYRVHYQHFNGSKLVWRKAPDFHAGPTGYYGAVEEAKLRAGPKANNVIVDTRVMRECHGAPRGRKPRSWFVPGSGLRDDFLKHDTLAPGMFKRRKGGVKLGVRNRPLPEFYADHTRAMEVFFIDAHKTRYAGTYPSLDVALADARAYVTENRKAMIRVCARWPYIIKKNWKTKEVWRGYGPADRRAQDPVKAKAQGLTYQPRYTVQARVFWSSGKQEPVVLMGDGPVRIRSRARESWDDIL